MIEVGPLLAERLELRRCPDPTLRRAEDQPADPGMQHRSETHQTGLDRAVQGRTDQPVVSLSRRRGPDDHDLRVGCRVGPGDRFVVATADHLVFNDQQRTDRHLAGHAGLPGELQSLSHEVLIVVAQNGLGSFRTTAS